MTNRSVQDSELLSLLDDSYRREFAQRLLAWWDTARRDLPWRRRKDAYAIWIAEVMLQQTQIDTVIPYYERWMGKFPDVATLARHSLEEVLKSWQGLGYYGRARNIHAAAREIVATYEGRLPAEVDELAELPGIGRYTAGAIASIAFNRRAPVVDGNVTRVFSRLLDLEDDVTESSTRRKLWAIASTFLPAQRPGDYNQALMELGQRICLPAMPRCPVCPVADLCRARLRGTQHERPNRPPRKRAPHFVVVAGIIWRSVAAVDKPFLITRRPLDGMLGGLWEFPGGKVRGSETLQEGLRREIWEELRIDIEVGKQLCVLKHAYTHFHITLHTFYALHQSGVPQHVGVADHAWVFLSELDRYPFAVTDLKIIQSLKAALGEQ